MELPFMFTDTFLNKIDLKLAKKKKNSSHHCRWLQVKLEQNQLSLEETRTSSALCSRLLTVC